MMNGFVKNETVSKFWLTEITGPTPDGIPSTLRICWLEETDRNFRNLCIGIMANIRGLHVLMHCSMASQVMESFLSFFQVYGLSMLLNYQIYFGIVAASKVNSPLSHGGHIGYDVCILRIKSRRCVFNFSGLQLIMLNKIIVVCSCAQITDQKVN